MLRSEAWNGSASRNRSARRRCLPNSAVDQRSSTIAWRWRDETSRRSDKQPRRPYGAFQTVRHGPLGDSRSRSDAVAAQFSNRRFPTPPDAGAPGHRPVQNAGDVLDDRGADQTRKRRFAIAKDRHGSAGSPSLFPKRLAQRRQRRDRTLRRKSKASRRFPSDFNLAKSDVDVSRLNSHERLECELRSPSLSRSRDRGQARVLATSRPRDRQQHDAFDSAWLRDSPAHKAEASPVAAPPRDRNAGRPTPLEAAGVPACIGPGAIPSRATGRHPQSSNRSCTVRR